MLNTNLSDWVCRTDALPVSIIIPSYTRVSTLQRKIIKQANYIQLLDLSPDNIVLTNNRIWGKHLRSQKL